MFKVTPNPPDTDPTSPYEPDSKKLNEAAERALAFHFPSIADIKATPRTPGSLFTIHREPRSHARNPDGVSGGNAGVSRRDGPPVGGSSGRWIAQCPAGDFQQRDAGGDHGEPGAGSD
ncbi:hypothetical protein EMIT0P4_120143 [Pseudomonas sp. IT-P4]